MYIFYIYIYTNNDNLPQGTQSLPGQTPQFHLAPVGRHEQSPWRGIRDPVQPDARVAQLLAMPWGFPMEIAGRAGEYLK